MKLDVAAARCFYHQERVGLNGRIVHVHKFRTMRADAEATTGPVWSAANDPRVTPIGRFLRRTRLDELPQLWNVLRGDMSLVGPRPERPAFVEQLTEQIPFYGQRHVVKPGLTGWAQVRYTYGASVEDAIEKLQYDLYYIKNLSLALDLVIVLETIKTVVLRRGATMTRPRRDIVNAMSVDVEDYFQVSAFDRVVSRAGWDELESRVVREHRAAARAVRPARRARDVLRPRLGGRAVPGAGAARSRPAGHEIASHGYHHQLIYTLTPRAVSRGRPRARRQCSRTRPARPCSAIARRAIRSSSRACGRSTS